MAKGEHLGMPKAEEPINRKLAKWIDRWFGKEWVTKTLVAILAGIGEAIAIWRVTPGWSILVVTGILILAGIYWRGHMLNEFESEAKTILSDAEREWEILLPSRRKAAAKIFAWQGIPQNPIYPSDEDIMRVQMDDEVVRVVRFWERFCENFERWKYDPDKFLSPLMKPFVAYCAALKPIIKKDQKDGGNRFLNICVVNDAFIKEYPEFTDIVRFDPGLYIRLELCEPIEWRTIRPQP
jgi:hypothetical protein